MCDRLLNGLYLPTTASSTPFFGKATLQLFPSRMECSPPHGSSRGALILCWSIRWTLRPSLVESFFSIAVNSNSSILPRALARNCPDSGQCKTLHEALTGCFRPRLFSEASFLSDRQDSVPALASCKPVSFPSLAFLAPS